MHENVLSGYDRAEHYNSSVGLDKDLEADIRVFTVYGDSTNSMDEEFRTINIDLIEMFQEAFSSSLKEPKSLQITMSSL